MSLQVEFRVFRFSATCIRFMLLMASRYVHAKSALHADYLHTVENIEEAISYMVAVMSDACDDGSVTSEMKSKAETQAAELSFYVSSLNKNKRRKRDEL